MDTFNRYALHAALTLIFWIPGALAAQSLAVLYPSQIIPSPTAECGTGFGGSGFGGIDMCASKATISSNLDTYVYSRNQTTGQWVRWTRLDAKHGDTFRGFHGELHNNTAVVPGFSEARGSHFDVFVHEGGIWRLRQVLRNTLGASIGPLSDRWFVTAHIRDCNDIICTADEAHGVVFVYERQSNGTFALSARLAPRDRGPNQALPQGFGSPPQRRVAIVGDTLLVGAPGDRKGTGAVFMFRFQSGSWRELPKLTAVSPRQAEEGEGVFGHSVAVRGNLLAIGEAGELVLTFPPIPWAVQMYVHDGTIWQPKQKLVHPELPDTRFFGNNIGLDSQRVVIDGYVFERSGVQWTPAAKLDVGPTGIDLSGNVLLASGFRNASCGFANVVRVYDLYSYATR